MDWIKYSDNKKNDKSTSTVYWMDNNTLKKEISFWGWRNLECLYRDMFGDGGGGRGGGGEGRKVVGGGG